MSQHNSLRNRTEQHKPKNKESKNDDKNIAIAIAKTIEYINEKFKQEIEDKELRIEFSNSISLEEMRNFILRKKHRPRELFDNSYLDRVIKPDGGVIYLVNKDGEKLPLVIAEVKHQGTNKERQKEGKQKQAVGNAIERLGKNLTGIRTMMFYEEIVPFVCFGWGCDFGEDESAKTVLAKVVTLNEFYPLNTKFIFKRDGINESRVLGFSPVSMFFREKEWNIEEMYEITSYIAETAFRYYVN